MAFPRWARVAVILALIVAIIVFTVLLSLDVVELPGTGGLSCPRFAAVTTRSAAEFASAMRWHHAETPLKAVPLQFPEGCRLEFVQYVPSVWETEWRRSLEDNQHRVCEALWERPERPHAWEAAVTARQADPSKFWTAGGGPPHDVMSRMDYKVVCSHDAVPNEDIVGAVVEPLVGLLRHPRACTSGLPASVKHTETHDPNFVMAAANVPLVPGGKPVYSNADALLFDVGSGAWNVSWSQHVLSSQYAASGFALHRFVAWSATPLPAIDAWQHVPEAWRHAYVWVNVPCDVAPGASMNPWTWMKSLARPEDFLAFKLDVEHSLVNQLADDPDALNLVDELFVDSYNAGAVSLVDAVDTLVNLRKLGVRAHSWPTKQ